MIVFVNRTLALDVGHVTDVEFVLHKVYNIYQREKSENITRIYILIIAGENFVCLNAQISGITLPFRIEKYVLVDPHMEEVYLVIITKFLTPRKRKLCL